MHQRHWPLKTFTALPSPFSRTQRRNQGYFFHSAFMSKGATECVIWSGELSVGRQLALDSMKDLAIHSSFSLVDSNIIRGIIVECGCRRGANCDWTSCLVYFQLDLWLQFTSGFLHRKEQRMREVSMPNQLLMSELFLCVPRLNKPDL